MSGSIGAMVQVGWCVIFADGFTAFFKEQGTATNYAVKSHGVLEALYIPDRKRPALETINTKASDDGSR